MDKDDMKEYIHDKKIVDKAIEDAQNEDYDPPPGTWNPIPSQEKAHDLNTYNDAYREAKD